MNNQNIDKLNNDIITHSPALINENIPHSYDEQTNDSYIFLSLKTF